MTRRTCYGRVDSTNPAGIATACRAPPKSGLTVRWGVRVVLLQFPEGEYMANLEGLEAIVGQLRVERTNLVTQLRHVDAALSVLGKLNGGRP